MTGINTVKIKAPRAFKKISVVAFMNTNGGVPDAKNFTIRPTSTISIFKKGEKVGSFNVSGYTERSGSRGYFWGYQVARANTTVLDVKGNAGNLITVNAANDGYVQNTILFVTLL